MIDLRVTKWNIDKNDISHEFYASVKQRVRTNNTSKICMENFSMRSSFRYLYLLETVFFDIGLFGET